MIVSSRLHMKNLFFLTGYSPQQLPLSMKFSSAHYPLFAEVNIQTHTGLVLIWRAISKMSFPFMH